MVHRPNAILLMGLLGAGCAAPSEARPALTPLTYRGAPQQAPDFQLSKERVGESDVPNIEVHRSTVASLPIVQAKLPRAKYTTVVLYFKPPSSLRMLRESRVVLGLLRREITSRLPAGTFTSLRGSALKVVCSNELLESVMKTIGEASNNAEAALSRYKSEKKRVLQNIASNRQGVMERVFNLARIARFGADSRFAEGPATSINTLAKISKKRVLRIWPRVVNLRRASLIVSGPNIVEMADSMVAPYFKVPGDAPVSESEDRPTVTPARKEGGHHYHALWYSNFDQVNVYAHHVGPDRSHPDYLPFVVLGTVLDGGYLGETNRVLRHDLGATYGVATRVESSIYMTELFSGGSVQPKQALRFMDLHLKKVRKLRAKELSEEEFQKAIARYRFKRMKILSDPERVADRLKGCIHQGVQPDYQTCLSPSAIGVTRKDVLRVAQTYLRDENLDWSLVGQLDAFRNELEFKGTIYFYKIDR